MHVVMLHGTEPRKILENVVVQRMPAIMSYLSKGKWHVAKVTLSDLGDVALKVEISPRKDPQPINVSIGQSVGMSFKHGYGKFIFETKILALEPSPNPGGAGVVALVVPEKVELVEKRSYYRVNVPPSLEVIVDFWHSRHPDDHKNSPASAHSRTWKGQLVDLSAGGLQLAIDAKLLQDSDFKSGQFIGLQFVPIPYEDPLTFTAQLRNISPTANGRSVCFGMQIVGLELDFQGRSILSKIVQVVEQYHQINQS